MKDDFWEGHDVKEWLEHATTEMMPKMKESALSVAIWTGQPDAKLAVEIGAAILYEKPLILLVTDGHVPRALERVATAIVRGDPKEPETRERLMRAIQAHVPRSAQ